MAGQTVGEPIEGGWRIKTSDDGRHYIDVMWMLYNYRVATTPVALPFVFDRFWCYAGRTEADLQRAVLAAWAWDGADDTEPVGWNKNGQTGEWRAPS
jgi:hypothetical protein